MTSEELMEALRESGTGVPKLEAAEAYLRANDDALAEDLVEAMTASGDWPEGTIAKAKRLLGIDPEDAAPAHEAKALDQPKPKAKGKKGKSKSAKESDGAPPDGEPTD